MQSLSAAEMLDQSRCCWRRPRGCFLKRPLLAVFGALAALLGGAAAHADASSEASAASYMSSIEGNPALLRMFLQAMPKGGDLHNHLPGVPSAEDYLGWAADAGYCADRATLELVAPPCDDDDKIEKIARSAPFEFARLVNHLSTRGWQQGIGSNDVSGHTQFFITFDRLEVIAPIEGLVPAMMTVALRNAAGDGAAYLELMHNPVPFGQFIFSAPDGPLDAAGLEKRLSRELPFAAKAVAASRAELDRSEAAVRKTLGCGTERAEPACDLKLKYLGSGLRGLPPGQVFRSLLVSFAMADADPRFVGVNIVMPEDWPVSLRDYDLHMAMFRVLHRHFPEVRITMHAGELAFGLVPPAEMKDHMRKAIEAGAERIGHGTAIAYEDNADATLRGMARDGIAVEINLTSNAVILGVSGAEHPLHLYRRYGVPVMLSTDDEGILRTDLTHEFVRAVLEQGLEYADLKEMSRASLEYAFLPGPSLWRNGALGTPVSECARSFTDPSCQTYLSRSERAAVQAGLEQKLEIFERNVTPVSLRKGNKG